MAGNSADTVRFSVLVSPDLSTGDTIRKQDYGIVADQTDFVLGPPEITGVNLGTVKSRLHRARNSFAQRIEPFLN